MLRRFVYLDSTALAQYVTVLEGGLITETTTRSLRSGAGTGGVNATVVQASGGRSREDEESHTVADTHEARFDRLLRAASAEPDALGWVDVTQPDTDFSGIGIGAMVSWECDVYVPEVIQALARSGETLGAIGMVQGMLPAARRLGLDTDGLPDDEEMSAVSSFLSSLNASLLAVGEDDDTDWRIAGQLTDEFLHGEIEGRAWIVGKVSKIIPRGGWKPYLTFPGMNLMSREERRKRERQAPAPGKEHEYLSGPALMLNLLAIYS
jgi:hypothetical protein